jgi:hypothetical protein
MGLRKSKELEILPEVPNSLVASAARVTLNDSSWRYYRLRDELWQLECWRLYDCIGELHFAAGWVGSACSRVRIYVAEVDKLGRVAGEVEDDEEVEAVSDTLFGGPASKAEALRAIGIALTVAGECYLIGLSKGSQANDGNRDRWLVVAPSELKRLGDTLQLRKGLADWVDINPRRDIVIRLWTPHPRMMDLADSPTRAATPILLELERLTRYVFSQIDSRLAGAGILPIPAGLRFPRADGTIGNAGDLLMELAEAAKASLSGEGSAAGVVPILVEMPDEALQAMKDKPISFESVMSEHAMELRDEAIRRLALAMDMPPEVMQGSGETNHFNAWHIEESAVKIHIEPLMTRICDGLTEAYLKPALKALGKDPDRYCLWYDTAPLTVRPNRLQDTLNLFERGIVSAEAVRRAGDYKESVDKPDQDEENTRFIKELLLRDPTLFQNVAIREAIGIEIAEVDPLALPAGQEGDPNAPGPAPPPAPERAVDSSEPGQNSPDVPARTRPQGQGGTSNGLIAGLEYVAAPSAELILADAMVHRALQVAGARLLTRAHFDQWKDVPKHELHTKIKVKDMEHADKLLLGAWDELPSLAEGLTYSGQLVVSNALDQYCRTIMLRSLPHSRAFLKAYLEEVRVL